MVFGKKQEEMAMVDSAEVEVRQSSTDQKTIAQELLDDARMDMSLKGVHPWRTSDLIQVKLALATIVMFQDRTAELLIENGTVEDRKGRKLPADVGYFALELTSIASKRLDEARKLGRQPGQTVEFDEQWRTSLYAESQLPYWPVFAPRGTNYEWQGGNVTGISTPFLRGIAEAAHEIHDNTYVGLHDLSHSSAYQMPPEHASVPAFIEDQLEQAGIDIEEAEQLLAASREKLTPNLREDIYIKVHDGFVASLYAATALVTPQMLGPDFAPIRE